MAEPENQTLEVLKRIQANISDIKTTQTEHTSRFDKVDEQLEALAGNITHAVGLSSETRVDIDMIRKEIKNMQARLKALEDTR